MSKFLLSLIVIFVLKNNTHAQNGWQVQQSNVNLNLKSVCFVNSKTGWAAGDSGVILKTSDGGLNWIRQISNTNKPLSHIVFIDNLKGTAAGSSYEYNPWCFDRLVLLATSNGGTNWSVIIDQLSSKLHDVSFAGGDIYAAYEGRDIQCLGSTGFITKSDNGGFNWYYSLGTQFGYKSVSFINSYTGWALGEYSTDFGLRVKQIIKSTDAGASWFIIRSDTNIYTYDSGMRFYDQVTGYKISNSLLKSTDGGYTWNRTDSIMTTGARSFDFINIDTGWCIRNGALIVRTNNGGMNWSYQISNTIQSLNSVFFVNEDTGYIACSGGVILKTVTGGLTNFNQEQEIIPVKFILHQNYPNPFNPSTNIKYDLPADNFVSIVIYDVLGKEVIKLVNEFKVAGSYIIAFNAADLSGGMYFYKMSAGSFEQIRKMVFLK